MRRLFAIAFFVCACVAHADTWDQVRGLRQGERILIATTDGQRYSGEFQSASADGIAIQSDRNAVSIDRAKVRRVQVRSTGNRVRNALIGAGIGVAIGVTIDQTLGLRLRNEGNDSGRALMYVAPIGLLGGLGAAFPSYRTIYKTP